MSAKDVTGPSREDAAAELVRELLAEAELDRLEALTPQELRKELDEAGIPPGWGQNLLKEVMAKVAAGTAEDVEDDAPVVAPPAAQPLGPKSNVVSLEDRRRARARVFAIIAAAAVVLLVIGVVWRNPMIRQQIDAWFSPNHPAPVPTQPPLVPPTQEESPKQKADRLREEAFVDVKKWYFDEAWNKLQDAKELDPAGDADPAVQEAYGKIAAGYPKPTWNSAKPPVQKRERPLQRH